MWVFYYPPALKAIQWYSRPLSDFKVWQCSVPSSPLVMSTFREGQSTARSVVSWALAMVSLHHLGFVAGALLVVDGIIGLMVGPGMGLDTIQWVQELAIVCFGVILVLVESSERATLPFCGVSRGTDGGVTTKLRQILFHYAKFVFVPYGRGAFYVYCSILLFAQYPDKLDVTIAVFMLSLSIVVVLVGCRTEVKLKVLKKSFNDASDIRTVFSKFQDTDKRLSRAQFWSLANGMWRFDLILHVMMMDVSKCSIFPIVN